MKVFNAPVLCVLGFLLMACRLSENQVATAIAETQAAMPVAASELTAPTIPLSAIELGQLVAPATGDLPAGISPAQVRADPPSMFSNLPPAVNQIFLQFEQDGEGKGGTAIFLFESGDDVNGAFGIIEDGFVNPRLDPDLGEEVAITLVPMFGSDDSAIDVVFTRCHAVVHIRMFNAGSEAVVAYANTLDEKLIEAVCR